MKFWKLQSVIWTSGLTKRKLIVISSIMLGGVIIGSTTSHPEVSKKINERAKQFGKLIKESFGKSNDQNGSGSGRQESASSENNVWSYIKKGAEGAWEWTKQLPWKLRPPISEYSMSKCSLNLLHCLKGEAEEIFSSSSSSSAKKKK